MSNLYYIQQVGPNLVMLSPVGEGHPDQGLPGAGGRPGHLPAWPERPVDPGFGWGGGERPGHLPAYGGGRPVDPDYGYSGGGRPDQGLPRPPILLPGYTLVLVRNPQGNWTYAAVQPGVPVQPLPPIPDQGLPQPPLAPDQGLPPGSPGAPDQGLPGHPGVPPQVGGGPIVPPGQPPTAGQLPGQPPTAQPKR